MNALITTIVNKLQTENKFYANYRNFNFEVDDHLNFFDYKAEKPGKVAGLLVAYSKAENLIALQYTYKDTKDTTFYILQDLDLNPATGGGFTEIYLSKYIHQLQKETNSEITLDDITKAEELFTWKESVKKDIFSLKLSQLQDN
jgi:hypothetical protein